jgi:putative ABC transport system permease protein
MFSSMFSYYLRLGLRSLRRNPALTALMVLTLAVGVAASIATLTVLHVMSADPIPAKSERIFAPVIDVAPAEGYKPEDPGWVDPQLTYRDAMAFLKAPLGERKFAAYAIAAPIERERPDLPVLDAGGMAVTRDFFTMLDVPFQHGQSWSEADDQAGADLVVLSHAMAETLFGGIDPVGKRIRLMGHEYQVIGVLKPWRMTPKFYRLNGGPGAFAKEEDFYLPLASSIRHERGHSDSMSCMEGRDNGWQGLLVSECTWIQFFFELRSASERADLQAYVDNYVAEQRRLGRMKRHAPNKLYDVKEWLDFRGVVANDSRLSAWLAFGFLLLCLVNTVGLLLAKLSARAPEVGVRRALGASRRDIFQQYLTEAGVVGLAGGVLGLVLSFGMLALIGMQSDQMKTVARMDWQMLLLTFAMAVAASVLAGLLPTWRACQVTPALQLKSQ